MGKRRHLSRVEDENQDELDLRPSDERSGTLVGPADASPRKARISGGALGSDPAAPGDGADVEDGLINLPALTLDDLWRARNTASIGVTPMGTVRLKRLLAVGATVAFAAALGALAGSLATGGLGTTAARSGEEEAVKQTLERVEQELTALRTSLQASAEDGYARTKRITDRLERSERAQAEPAQKLAKIAEAVERLERRGAQAAPTAAALDVTGAIGERRGGAADAKRASILDGWALYEVRHGAAVIEGRGSGLFEVEPGDLIPGLGRIETIRKQDGRWVVVTSRGLVVEQR